jgi:hypothetical protein
MRQLLKNTFTLAVALVFTAGMAFGQAQDGEDVTIQQVNGNKNFAEVRHNSFAPGAESFIRQKGSKNKATAFIETTSGDEANVTDQDQIGDRNTASINAPFSGPHTVTQYQEGDDNTARAGVGFQTGASDGSLNINADITQRQVGDRNFTRLQGDGIGSEVYQRQVGDDNTIRFDLPQTDDGNLSSSDVDQKQLFGDQNTMVVESTSGGQFDGLDDVTVDMVQRNGDFNAARVTGLNDGSEITTLQRGNNNLARGTMSGSTNVTFDVTQRGNQNTALYDNQTGN